MKMEATREATFGIALVVKPRIFLGQADFFFFTSDRYHSNYYKRDLEGLGDRTGSVACNQPQKVPGAKAPRASTSQS